ncbi:MAG: hypothetical protein AB7E32_14405 [Desulfovibrio sp.]
MTGGTRVPSLLRKGAALTGTILVLWTLARIPYALLREERIRSFGETRTTVWVLERLPSDSRDSGLLRVRYRGPDGRAREAVLPVRREVWSSTVPGSGVVGFVARADPSLCRLRGQIEAPFQIWLRNALGYASQ